MSDDLSEKRQEQEEPKKEQENNSPDKNGEDSLPDKEIFNPDEFKPILDKLPEGERRKLQIALSVKRSWTAPFPPPDILKGYNDAVPNGADRILKMAENQSEHRMNLENNVINRELNQSGKGQNYGLIIALSFLAGSIFLIYTGHEISGAVLATIDLVALVSVFVFGKWQQKKDLGKKDKT